jgi:hypothetical protein
VCVRACVRVRERESERERERERERESIIPVHKQWIRGGRAAVGRRVLLAPPNSCPHATVPLLSAIEPAGSLVYHTRKHTHTHTDIHICMFNVYVYMLCLYACMQVCAYACMYVCMNLSICNVYRTIVS